MLADALQPLVGKTEAILRAPYPKNQQELKSLIGKVSYYQRILPDLATVLSPLYALLKKGRSGAGLIGALQPWTR